MSRALKDYNSIPWNEYFYHDDSSPTGLRWRCDRFFGSKMSMIRVAGGSVAGMVHHQPKKGTKYAIVGVEGRNWYAHRVIWILYNGHLPGDLVIDHIDGNALNNRIENLRAVPQKLNNRNASKRKDNTSGETGVYFTTARAGKNRSSTLTYATATWYDISGTRRSKHFPVKELGVTVAFKMAIEHRKRMISELNQSNACYTTNHGLSKTGSCNSEQKSELK